MILQALRQLAINEELVGDPDYQTALVSWVVRLRGDGSLIQIDDHRRNVNEGRTNRKGEPEKPRWEGKPEQVPRQPIRTSGDRAFFFVDKSEYVLATDPTGDRPAEKLAVRAKLFRDQVEACAQANGDAVLQAVVTFLKAVAEQGPPPLPQECTPSDLFAFRVGMEGWVHLRPAVRNWWKQQRSGDADSVNTTLRCLVTGAPIGDVELFPLIKRVPGGTSSGVSLVSYNANAFESYGLKSNENAPVSRAAAELAGTALNRLLHPAFPDPQQNGQAMSRRNVRLSANTAVCYWATSKSADGFLDNFAGLIEAEDEQRVAGVFQSMWGGRPVALDDPSAFYALTLSGTQGRAIVRDWIEMTVAEVAGNLVHHFEDLRIVRHARPAKGKTASPAVPLRRLMESLAPEGKSDQVPDALASDFVHSAITGRPYPFKLLQRALLRERAEAGRSEWNDTARRDARAALIKAVLNRRWRSDPLAAGRYQEVTAAMNPNHVSDGYTLGLLMAVLERLQATALGDVNASVVDRYFSAASATPRSVFVRLLKNAKHHARKAKDSEHRGQVMRYEKLVDELASRFDFDPKRYPAGAVGIPAHLDLEQQGLFVLGYHQMRHWLWMNRGERSAWEIEQPDAPRAFRWSRSADPEAVAEPAASE